MTTAVNSSHHFIVNRTTSSLNNTVHQNLSTLKGSSNGNRDRVSNSSSTNRIRSRSIVFLRVQHGAGDREGRVKGNVNRMFHHRRLVDRGSHDYPSSRRLHLREWGERIRPLYPPNHYSFPKRTVIAPDRKRHRSPKRRTYRRSNAMVVPSVVLKVFQSNDPRSVVSTSRLASRVATIRNMRQSMPSRNHHRRRNRTKGRLSIRRNLRVPTPWRRRRSSRPQLRGTSESFNRSDRTNGRVNRMMPT